MQRPALRRIGFIGFGGIAQAMANGLLLTGAAEPGQLCACARDWEKLCQNTARLGIRPCRNALETIGEADLVVIAVKPNQVEGAVAPLGETLRGKIVLSVAAGWLFEDYEKLLAPGTHHLCVIPSLPVSVGAGILICEERHSLSPEEWELVRGLLSKIGLVERVETPLLGVASTVAGCGPAFAALFLEALGDAGVMHGLPRALAYRLAGQMLSGTGQLQVKNGGHPGTIKDAVCSPGGSTIVGVAALERGGFRSAVIEAVDEIQRR